MSERTQDRDRGDVGSRASHGGEHAYQTEQQGGPDARGEQAQDGKSGEDRGKEQRGGQSKQGEGTGPTTTQWVVGIASTLLVLVLLGFLIYEAVSGTESPPVITVRVERVLSVPDGYMVEVGVYNEGGSTASALEIEGTLKQDTTTVETSTATIQYVPAETEREAGLFFTKDPNRYRLEVRPLGYDRP
jgi:uncharacterized protein (TIGR02588 family)